MVLINLSPSQTKIKHMFHGFNAFRLPLKTKLTKWPRDQKIEKSELSLLTMKLLFWVTVQKILKQLLEIDLMILTISLKTGASKLRYY
jgi:hypothetical protein